jgi:hypothetical protein
MKTKKFLILSICLLFIGNVSVSADNNNGSNRRDIPLSNEGKNEDTNKEKSLTQVPFYAYYQEGIVYIGTTGEFTAVDVTIENTTTGTVYTEVLNMTDCTDSVDISTGGAGSYTLEIETEYGDEFVGYFTLY